MEALFAAPIILFVLLCLGVIIHDLLWQSQEEGKESLANRGHQCGCPWCGHFVPCEREDCPISDRKK